MSRQPVTVASLAAEVDADLDETLVTLWDAGIEDVSGPLDRIPSNLVRRARSALGADDPKRQRTVEYWLDRAHISRSELAAYLCEVGIELKPNARVLPTGALRRLRRRFATAPEPVNDQTISRATATPEPLAWDAIGLRRDLQTLTEREIMAIHEALVDDFAIDDDPISPPGVKSMDLLSSAASRPLTSLGDERKYPTAEMAGAALLHSLVQNHAFHNGNKRTAIVALLVFLDDNGLLLTCSDEELFRFVLRVAQHRLATDGTTDFVDREVYAIATWIFQRSRPIAKGERMMQWHKLRRILRRFDCVCDQAPSVGNRMNITRQVERKGHFLRTRTQTLVTQVYYGGEGQLVVKNTLNRIRKELELDEAHGVDSLVFYEEESTPSDFIQQYRVILRRLARL